MDLCVQDVGEMNWGSVVQMLRKPIQLLVLQQHEGGAACKALGREWVDSAFFAKDLDLQPMALYYFVVAPTIAWMLKRKKHRSFDVFNMAMMCSWERSKRATHGFTVTLKTHVYLQKNTSISVKGSLWRRPCFFIPKYPQIRIGHPCRTMQQLKPTQPIMVSKDVSVSFGNVSSTWST